MQQAPADNYPANVCVSTELILGFVNTRVNGNGRRELLDDAASFAGWLAGSGLADRDVAVTNADAVAARELRDALVVMLRAHVGCVDGTAMVSGAEAYLQRIAERYPLTPKLSVEGCTLVPSQTGVPGAFGSLLAATADLAYRGAWPRLKVCKNSACYTGFFDKTRNSSGLYCGPACSSQMSMRAYRSRLKNG
jgi:predicted RNA-binding Zn ribbon-like protein